MLKASKGDFSRGSYLRRVYEEPNIENGELEVEIGA